MIATDRTPLRFTPPWLEDRKADYFYLVKPGSVIERGQLEAELSGEHRAGRVFSFELAQAFRDGLLTLMKGDPETDRYLDLADRDAEGETLDDADRQALLGVRSVLSQHWPAYRELAAQADRRREMLPILAFRRFVTGWQGPEAAFARGIDGVVADDALGAVDPLEMMVVGTFAYSLLYGGGRERDFPLRSPSDASLAPSPSGEHMATDGRSTASAGKRTRGSRSPRTSSRSSTSG